MNSIESGSTILACFRLVLPETLRRGEKFSRKRSQCCTVVTRAVTFGLSRQKGPLLSGSRYFRMVKKRLHGNSWSFQAKGTRNMANTKLAVPFIYVTNYLA